MTTSSRDSIDFSVVVCSCNQAPRLRMVLSALSAQTLAPREVIVSDDASSDRTESVVSEASAWFAPGLPVRFRRNPTRLGAPATRNLGAREAEASHLLFLDGDVVAAPTLLEELAAAHAEHERAVTSASRWHTTTTEFLRDPESGELFDQVPVPEEIRAALAQAPETLTLRLADIRHDFSALVARAAPGLYPHLDRLEALYDLRSGPQRGSASFCLVNACCMSLDRRRFLDVGGFDEGLRVLEHWDLALRFHAEGDSIVRVPQARTYHLYHHRPTEEADGTIGEAFVTRWTTIRELARRFERPSLVLIQPFMLAHMRDPWIPYELVPQSIEALGQLMDDALDDFGPWGRILAAHPLLSEL